MPLYRHPILRSIGEPEGEWFDPDAGSVTDGDDHIFLGDKRMLTNGNWRELIEDPFKVLGKRPSSTKEEGSSDTNIFSSDGNLEGGTHTDVDLAEMDLASADTFNHLTDSEDGDEVRWFIRFLVKIL